MHNSRIRFRRVVEIAGKKTEKNGMHVVFVDVEKIMKGVHSQDDTSHAVALFLHHGYEHNMRFLSLAKLIKRMNYINMIYVRMFEFVVQN